MTSRARSTLAATALTALALTACGADDSGAGAGPSASPRDRAHEGALKFARCMRDNGVDLPDPQVGRNGLVKIAPRAGDGSGASAAPTDPAFRRADERCRKHLAAGGGAPDEAMVARHRDAFVAYARCMRAEGIDMPDPSGAGGIVMRPGEDGLDPRSPRFRRADGACHKHLAGVDRELGVR